MIEHGRPGTPSPETPSLETPSLETLCPEWSVPDVIQAIVTTRTGGASDSSWGTLNLGVHTGDDARTVVINRASLIRHLGLAQEPVWLNQVHGNEVFIADADMTLPAEADASYTTRPGVALVIMVADCLPILICSTDGREIAAIHAGWRGLANGIIARVVGQFRSNDLSAWLGPGIGRCHYEVDAVVKRHFDSEAPFSPSPGPGERLETNPMDHWMFDLSKEARDQLQRTGVIQIQSENICTYCDNRFYSYRRDGVTGRFAALIWIKR